MRLKTHWDMISLYDLRVPSRSSPPYVKKTVSSVSSYSGRDGVPGDLSDQASLVTRWLPKCWVLLGSARTVIQDEFGDWSRGLNAMRTGGSRGATL